MRKKVLNRKSEFKFRKKVGYDFELRVEKILNNQGILTARLNVESLPNNHIKHIRFLTDNTSKFLKLLPDFICTIPGKYTFFLECKKSTLDSKYYSFALDEFNFQKLSAETFNIEILLVFTDWTSMLKAQWIDKITDYREFINTKSTKGSNKDFILIPKNSIPLLSLTLTNISNIDS